MKILLLTLPLAILATHAIQAETEVLNITLYYEALCPGCQDFIRNQLHPAYSKISSNLRIELVPYGNTIREEKDGKQLFTCQHGEDECAINKIEACGLARSNDQDKQIGFVNCVESIAADSTDLNIIAECATHQLGLKGHEILQCSQGPEGDSLYEKLYEQQSLAGKIDYVPWINLNGKHSESFEDAAVTDFLTAACEQFHTIPKGCL